MTGDNEKPGAACEHAHAPREFTHVQELIDNLPYLLMGLLGGAVLLAGLGFSPRGWLAAGLYGGYCLAGALWIVRFVCPYCHFYGSRACPCGYGQLAARLTPPAPAHNFAGQFRKHIPVIVPLWLIPPAAGLWFLRTNHSPWLPALLLVFAVDAFVLLPLVARLYGCGHCLQKADCPWMFKGNNERV